MDSNSNSYRTEPTVFNSNTNCDTNSGINYNANSIAKSNNAYKAPI